MIKGTYIFYEDGKEVYRSSNVVTKFGKRFLTNFIAGRTSFNEKSIAIGIDEIAATENDTRLGLEFYRTPVEFGSTDINTVDGVSSYSVIYKTTLPQSLAGVVHEVGLYPQNTISLNNFDSKFLAGFDSQLDWYSSSQINPDYIPENSRVGENVLEFLSGNSESKEYFSNINSIDLSGYSVNDTVRFAYYQNDLNLSSIKIKLYSSNSDYYSATITASASLGYKISDDISMSQFLNNPTGTPDVSDITKIGIEIVPIEGEQSSIGADALRINDEDTFNPVYGLVSRSVLSAPLVKLAGRQVDIEYRLDLTF
jgi:hypothetical protein